MILTGWVDGNADPDWIAGTLAVEYPDIDLGAASVRRHQQGKCRCAA